MLRYRHPRHGGHRGQLPGRWLVDLLGLPDGSDVGFVTGATMANFTGLAAARWRLLADAGWDLDRDGLAGAPRIRCLVGQERHDTVDLALRYLGLGQPAVVPSDRPGQDCARRAGPATGPAGSGPALVCLQAGNLHSGAFDPFTEAVGVAEGTRCLGPRGRCLRAVGSRRARTCRADCRAWTLADSWGTDAHKTLNVPYDCGIAIVRDAAALRSAMGVHASYLIQDAEGAGDPFEKVPELSRRARGVPVWAALRSWAGTVWPHQVRGLVPRRRISWRSSWRRSRASRCSTTSATPRFRLAFGDDATTRAVTARIIEDGKVWMSGSRWQGRDVLRVSVSNWSTDADDVGTAVEAVRSAFAAESRSRPRAHQGRVRRTADLPALPRLGQIVGARAARPGSARPGCWPPTATGPGPRDGRP